MRPPLLSYLSSRRLDAFLGHVVRRGAKRPEGAEGRHKTRKQAAWIVIHSKTLFLILVYILVLVPFQNRMNIQWIKVLPTTFCHETLTFRHAGNTFRHGENYISSP